MDDGIAPVECFAHRTRMGGVTDHEGRWIDL
jgi:hypothetical protein